MGSNYYNGVTLDDVTIKDNVTVPQNDSVTIVGGLVVDVRASR